MTPAPGPRRGGSLAELVLAMTLFALVLTGLGRFAGAQARLAAAVSDRVRFEELVRATRLILRRELRYLAPGDLHISGSDSIGLRAVRGTGTVCEAGDRHVVVRYRGVRGPDPAKDSLLLIADGDRSGAGAAYALASVVPDPACGGGLRLGLEREPAPGSATALAIVFEKGSYHLSGGALRYRRGAGGRQPLTEALLRDGSLVAGPSRSIRIRLSVHDDSLVRLTPREHRLEIRPAPEPDPGGTTPP
ncbi:MAG: hypothetical protein P8177_13800 [Gemmatimonadota bacterium]|jgi:hypothetical protein